MIRLGTILMFFGFGSVLLYFVNYEFTVLSWATEYQPALGLGLGAVGAVVVIIKVMTSKGSAEEPEPFGPPLDQPGGQQFFGPPPGQPQGPPPQQPHQQPQYQQQYHQQPVPGGQFPPPGPMGPPLGHQPPPQQFGPQGFPPPGQPYGQPYGPSGGNQFGPRG